mmetsp:Transcript_52709/g.104614  ORF Transcript_52709/g.104614 Transcript_52709/m.104614 type:complete len:300 (-) Transcript_52709:621-1520(-)
MLNHLKSRSRCAMNKAPPPTTTSLMSSRAAFPQSMLPVFLGKKLPTASLSMVFSHSCLSAIASLSPGPSSDGGDGQRTFHASASRLSFPLFAKRARPSTTSGALSRSTSPPLAWSLAAAAFGEEEEGACLVSMLVLAKMSSNRAVVVRLADAESLSIDFKISSVLAPFLATINAITVSAFARTLESLSFMQSRSCGRKSFILVPGSMSAIRRTHHSRRTPLATGFTSPSSLPPNAVRATFTHACTVAPPRSHALSMALTVASRIVFLESAHATMMGFATALRTAGASAGGRAPNSSPNA